MTAQSVVLPEEQAADVQARRAGIGAAFGFFVDMFDVFLPIIVLAPAYIYFQPPTISPTVAAIAASLVVAATLLGRPLGSVIFGGVSDRIGRKPTTMIAVAGFGVCTILMGMLPGYSSWGEASLYTLILLRFISGVFLGGEYTGANVLSMEVAPKHKRGFYSGLIQAGYPVAHLAIASLTFAMLALFPMKGIDSPYIAWGWRIPFFVGGLMALIFILPYQSSIQESKLWLAAGKTKSGKAKRVNPFKIMFQGENLRRFAQVFVMMSGFWLCTLSAAAGILPGALIRFCHLSPRDMTLVMMMASAVLIFAFVAVGAISQKIGRRPTILIMAVVNATVGLYTYYLLLASPHDFWVVAFLGTVVIVALTSEWGVTTCYLNERFPTRIRSSGFGMGFTLPVIIPSFYGLFQGALGVVMPPQFTVLVLVGIGAVLMFIGAWIGPETKDVDLHTME